MVDGSRWIIDDMVYGGSLNFDICAMYEDLTKWEYFEHLVTLYGKEALKFCPIPKSNCDVLMEE